MPACWCRIAIWNIALTIIAGHPVVGIGPDKMGVEFDHYRADDFNKAEGAGYLRTQTTIHPCSRRMVFRQRPT